MRAVDELEAWGWARRWSGTDPYEGLNAKRLGGLKRTPLGRRLLIQAVKRSPLELRPALGISPGLDAATVGQVLSAYSRLQRLGAEAQRERVAWAIDALERLRSTAFAEPCWGYHFDVETRVFGYPASGPNTIATAFAGFGLLDAHVHLHDDRARRLLGGVAEFFTRRTGRGTDAAGTWFGYLPGDQTSIHNANLLVCAFLARYADATGGTEVLDDVRAGVAYALACQRPDGSWPYGERDDLGWVDNHHTGYVLDSLRHCMGISGLDGVEAAYRRGLEYYAATFFEPDGAPRFYSTRAYPIDGVAVAQSLHTLSLAAEFDPSYVELAARVLDYALAKMRRPDGAFVFQRHRWWVDRSAHLRWVQAPMLDALTLVEVRQAGRQSEEALA
jgi:hypothetical protein